ncbi:uncharacterized protein ACNLHF_012278 isoform 2-T2 [Anomaloglossus baeobatrachus]|uniref:uncharacterized protein LOC142295792 isoform X2 n=1 Tax=Anomaloglossus baeobatrachus TaxID=238106 RepID=UPI003F50A2B7
MSPGIGLVLLLASICVSSLVAQEYGPDGSLQGYDSYDGVSKPEKPGSCPADVDFPICNPNVTYTPECEKDKNCTGARKCCYSGCTKRCLLPLQEKLNPCPHFNHSICIYVRPMASDCHNDKQCQGPDRCCCINCRHQCTKTVKVKSGQCPAPKKGFYGKSCTKDSDCTGTKKCCEQNGLKCVPPDQEHAGVCPISLENLSCTDVNNTLCRGDSDCPLEQKCCLTGENDLQCQNVTSGKERPVVTSLVVCKRFVIECGGDGDCSPGQKCCNDGCRTACTEV